MTDAPKTLAEATAILRRADIASNLTNLAQAKFYAEEGKRRMTALIAEIEALAAKVEAGEPVDVEAISLLYKNSRK